jgi:hypothetical protein
MHTIQVPGTKMFIGKQLIVKNEGAEHRNI